MQTSPFHTRPRYAVAPCFWHDNTGCTVGQHIAQAQRKVGVGTNTTHCPWCALLNEPLRSSCAPHVGVTVVRAQSKCKPDATRAAPNLPLT
jgi:hypothetical protein